MRIAMLTEGYLPELSGVTTSLYQRLRWLGCWGHEVRLYAPDYSGLAEMYPNYLDYVGEVLPGVTVCPYPSKPYYVSFARDAKPFTFGVVERDIRTFGPDVIHVECPERLFLGFLCRAGLRLGRKLRVPVTAFYHTNYLELIEDYKRDIPWLRIPGMVRALRSLVVWVYNSYDVTMVSSQVVQRKLEGFGVRNTELKGFLGVDTERFKPSPVAAEEDAVTVLYVGRITADKEIDLLLRAFDLLSARVPGLRYVFVGGGTEEDKVRAWCASHEGATFAGRVANEATAGYYCAADVFATACSKETFGLTVLEAMACGLPVVGPDAGGIAEVVENGATGLLFTPGDAEAFAEALQSLVTDAELRARLAAVAVTAAQARSWANGARAMLDVWEERASGKA